MLFKIALRNLFRNKRRTLIILSSIVVGVVAMILSDGLMNGMLKQMLFNQVRLNVSHLQIHRDGFNKDKTIKYAFSDFNEIEAELKNNPVVEAYSKRLKTYGLISSAVNSSGIYLNAVVPEDESRVSIIDQSIVEGSYFTGDKRDILIGTKLAKKLEVGVGDKIVVMSNTPDGSIGSELFRICGLFSTASSDFDKSTIFVPLETAQLFLDVENHISEFAVILKESELVENLKAEMIGKLGSSYEVMTYNDLLPFLVLQLDMYNEMMAVINFIIGLALIFGIINSMLMSVFERINELGVLMSIGMKNSKIFLMVLFEAFTLGIAGTIAGFVIGLSIHFILSPIGINLSAFASSLESFGIGAVIYPDLSLGGILSLLIIIPLISVAGAVYPAFKAIKLEPVTAVRYV